MTQHLPQSPQDEDRMVEEAFSGLLNAYLASKHRKKVGEKPTCLPICQGRPQRDPPPKRGALHIASHRRGQNRGLGAWSRLHVDMCRVAPRRDRGHGIHPRGHREFIREKIADIVEGLTKISGGIFGDRASIQAENFRKLLLSMSSDIRVVLIKMADRLHNMRTLGSMRPEKQYKIAGETLYVYAPLAHRLGLFKIKTELEDLAFKYEHPQAYEWITSKLDQTASHREKSWRNLSSPFAKSSTKRDSNMKSRQG